MSKKIKQIVTTQTELKNNAPVNILQNNEMVTMLGIQAAPGTKFQINNGGSIEMGFYGIYELDLERIGGLITSIVLTSPSPEAGSENSPIIIDMVYEDGGALT